MGACRQKFVRNKVYKDESGCLLIMMVIFWNVLAFFNVFVSVIYDFFSQSK